MKRLLSILLLAVVLPSVVLAWMALRSVRDQQYVLERQQTLLNQEIVDGLARDVNNRMLALQADFSQTVQRLEAEKKPVELARGFDSAIRTALPWVEVGFSSDGATEVFSPQAGSGGSRDRFLRENGDFLTNREPALVFTGTIQQNNSIATSPVDSVLNGWRPRSPFSRQESAAPAKDSAITPRSPAPASAPQEAVELEGALETSRMGESQISRLNELNFSDTSAPRPAAVAAPAPKPSEEAPAALASAGAKDAESAGKALNVDSRADSAEKRKRNILTSGSRQGSPGANIANVEQRQMLSKRAFSERRAQENKLSQNQLAVSEEAEAVGQDKQEISLEADLNQAVPEPSQSLPASETFQFPADFDPPQIPQDFGSTSATTLGDNAISQDMLRKVSPQQNIQVQPDTPIVSSVRAVETEFRTVTQGAGEGSIARLEKSGVNLLLWCRSSQEPELIYGVQVDREKLLASLRELVWVDEPLSREVCLALLDHMGKPVALSTAGFTANWKRPFVATEIGEFLPYWEASLYLVDPQRFTQSARTLRWTLGGMVGLLLAVITLGAGLVSREVAQRVHEARQKTDFVSNVSHELKTPLTSIRMFSELLAENRVTDPTRQKQYLNIIVSEAGRLTRLINNVLDFSRMERGEKRYRMESIPLGEQLGDVASMLMPNLQEQGMRLELDVPSPTALPPLRVLGDADALAQVWVNLVCNAEKYAASGKGITLRLEKSGEEIARILVEDRGPGVPRGLEKRIFEQFFRADDSLAASVQGSGLGLTLARQIVQAHRGKIWYEPRDGGGSRFIVELPLLKP